MGPQLCIDGQVKEFQLMLWNIPKSKCCVEYNDTEYDSLGRLRDVDPHPPPSCHERYCHLSNLLRQCIMEIKHIRRTTAAPDRRIALLPHLSTKYHLNNKIRMFCLQDEESTHGGTVLKRYIMALTPVIRIASLPCHPASDFYLCS